MNALFASSTALFTDFCSNIKICVGLAAPRVDPTYSCAIDVSEVDAQVRLLLGVPHDKEWIDEVTGNGVATVFVSWWERELDHGKLYAKLNREIDPSDLETAITTG